jgi:hypothetical protein
MSTPLLTPEAFAQSIKAKYPDYASVPDAELAAKMLEKYPEYRDRVQTPDFKQSDTTPNEEDPNTIGTFARHAGAFLNPVTAVTGMAHAVVHPIDTGSAIWQAHKAVFDKGKAEYARGNYEDAAVHFLNAAIPFFGPSIDKAAESVADKKYAAGFGDAVGIGASIAAPKVIGEAMKGRAVSVPGLKNPSAAEADAVAFGQARGIPVDAGTATGNRAVKGAQYLSDRSFGGSLVAGPAKEAQKAALTKVGGELADRARGAAVSPEQAGQGIRDALASKQQAHTALADASYEKLRQFEEDPVNRMQIANPKAPVDNLKDFEAAQLRRIVHEMDASGYTKRTINESFGKGGDKEVAQGSGGAKVYQDITQRLGYEPTRSIIQNELEDFLGGGKKTAAVDAALDVARERFRGRGVVSTPELPASAMQVPTRAEAARVTSTEMGLPVNTAAAKAAIKPLYDQMMRQMPVTQQQSSGALKAMSNILEGPDWAPLSQVDRDLSAIKEIARNQGGLAKFAAGKLDSAVQEAAANGGPDVIRALHTGRQATIAKIQTEGLIDALPGGTLEEPLAIFKRATAPKDGGIELLRSVKEQTPQALPQIARAKLEDILTMGPDKQFAEWNKLGTETRKILFPQTGQSQALDHFFLLSKKLAENFNPSGSGELVALGAQGAALVTNPVASIVGQVGAAGLSTLLHSPAGVRALTRGLSLSLGKTASVASKAAATAEIVNVARSLGLQLAPQAAGSTPPTTERSR